MRTSTAWTFSADTSARARHADGRGRGGSRLLIALGLGVVLPLAGCATIPVGLPATPVKVGEIIAALHCEFAAGVGQQNFFYGWAAGAELSLIANRTSAATPGVTLKPTVPEGKLTVPGSAAMSDTARQEFKFRDFVSLGALGPQTATGAQVLASCPKLSPESKGMGIGAALADLAQADANDGASYIQLELSNMIVNFTATRSLDGGLTFETPEYTASVNGAKVSRTFENKITITFVKDPAPPPLIADNEAFGVTPGGGSAGPSTDAIRALNEALDDLTDNECIKITSGDTVLEQCSK